jgi:large subunit ribosomal protein L10
MLRSEKQTAVENLKSNFDRMVSAVFVDFQGLNVASVTKLRDELRKASVDYKVVKNTLIKLALGDTAFAKDLGPVLTGMTAIAWSYEEPGSAAKVLKAFRKDNEKLKIKAGLIDGKVIDSEQVTETLANMPGKDQLRAQLLATLQAPAQQFVGQLAAAHQNFVYLLKAKQDKDAG